MDRKLSGNVQLEKMAKKRLKSGLEGLGATSYKGGHHITE